MKEKYLRAFVVGLMVSVGLCLNGWRSGAQAAREMPLEAGEDEAVRDTQETEREAAEGIASYPGLVASARQVRLPGEGEKICYLTFDDGPSSHTQEILDILSEYGAKATFFVIGNELTEESGVIVDRMKEEGHSIGLHANDHTYGELYASAESFLEDYEELYIRLKEDYGVETTLFRFPGGSVISYLDPYRETILEQMHKRGFACFDWQVSGEDAVGSPSAASIQENVFRSVFHYDTPIVLLHDGRGQGKTAEALPGILERLQAEGYRFATLENAPEYVYRAR